MYRKLIWDLKSPKIVGMASHSGRLFGKDGWCQVATTCMWGSRASQETFALQSYQSYSLFFPPVAGVDVWLGIQIHNVLCSRHLLTFHFKENWPIFYFEVIPAHLERKPVANLDLLFMRVLYTKHEVEKDWNLSERVLSSCHKFILEGNIQICLWKWPQNHRGLWLNPSACGGQMESITKPQVWIIEKLSAGQKSEWKAKKRLQQRSTDDQVVLNVAAQNVFGRTIDLSKVKNS